MFKIINLILDLHERYHKYMNLYHEKVKECRNWKEQYLNLYTNVQNILAENNETLVAHYDGTNIPEYTIEDIKNYDDSKIRLNPIIDESLMEGDEKDDDKN